MDVTLNYMKFLNFEHVYVNSRLHWVRSLFTWCCSYDGFIFQIFPGSVSPDPLVSSRGCCAATNFLPSGSPSFKNSRPIQKFLPPPLPIKMAALHTACASKNSSIPGRFSLLADSQIHASTRVETQNGWKFPCAFSRYWNHKEIAVSADQIILGRGDIKGLSSVNAFARGSGPYSIYSHFDYGELIKAKLQ